MEAITKQLFDLQDLPYRDFHAALIPSLSKDLVIGVRVPDMKKLAKKIANTPEAAEFLKQLPHTYYEENNLHAYLIDNIAKDYDTALTLTEEFLPYIDNWATCDTLTPKALLQDPKRFYEETLEWMHSDREYTIRFGLVMQLKYFLDDESFQPELLDFLATIHRKEYYINMAIAWYLSMALVKQYEKTIPYFTTPHFDPWIHNKALQKAVESLRPSKERKDFFKSLKIKN